jgi:hypothetical protein
MVRIPDDMLGQGSSAFKTTIANLEPENTYQRKWKGVLVDLDVYRVSISAPRNNLWNVRVKPWLGQYIHEEELPKDYWDDIDEEAHTTMRLVNDFLTKNPDRKDALAYFKRGELQLINEPLVCTPSGKVLNGNQRLCVYRELFVTDQGKYEHLGHAYVAILPTEGSRADERKLESEFQQEGLQDVYFDWVQQGLQDIEDAMSESPESIADRTNRTAADVKESIRKITLADEFLEYIERPECWQDLRTEYKVTQAISTLDSNIHGKNKNIKTTTDIEKLKMLSFKVMSEPDSLTGKGTSAHLAIGMFANTLHELSLPSEVPTRQIEDQTEEVDPLLQPIVPEQPIEVKEGEYEIKTTEDLVEVAIIKTQEAKARKESKNKQNYAVRQLKMLNTSLDNILSQWEVQKKTGMKALVNKAIRKLNDIKEKL